MSHDDSFAAFQERKRATEATEFKVTWRRATWGDVKGWSGLGPDGRLLFVAPAITRDYSYGDVCEGGVRTTRGNAPTASMAKTGAERWLRTNHHGTTA